MFEDTCQNGKDSHEIQTNDYCCCEAEHLSNTPTRKSKQNAYQYIYHRLVKTNPEYRMYSTDIFFKYNYHKSFLLILSPLDLFLYEEWTEIYNFVLNKIICQFQFFNNHFVEKKCFKYSYFLDYRLKSDQLGKDWHFRVEVGFLGEFRNFCVNFGIFV